MQCASGENNDDLERLPLPLTRVDSRPCRSKSPMPGNRRRRKSAQLMDECRPSTGTIFNEEGLDEIAEHQGVEPEEVKKQFSSPIGRILQVLILVTPALISPARPMLTDFAQRAPLFVQIDNLDKDNARMFYNSKYKLKRNRFLIPVHGSDENENIIATKDMSKTIYRGWFRPFVNNEYSVFLLAGKNVHAELTIGNSEDDSSEGGDSSGSAVIDRSDRHFSGSAGTVFSSSDVRRVTFSRVRDGSDGGADRMKISTDDELELRRSDPVRIQFGGDNRGKSIPFSVTVFGDSGERSTTVQPIVGSAPGI